MKLALFICIAVISALIVECYLLEDKIESLDEIIDKALGDRKSALDFNKGNFEIIYRMLNDLKEEQIRIGNAVAKASIDNDHNARQISDLKTAVRTINQKRNAE